MRCGRATYRQTDVQADRKTGRRTDSGDEKAAAACVVVSEEEE